MKKLLSILLAISLLSSQFHAQAQALPANFVMNRAVAGIVTKVALSRGFAANDPRIAATLAGVSSSMTAVNVASTVAGVGLSIAGAPVWLTIAAGLGILAAGSAIVAGNTNISIEYGGANGNKLKLTNSSASNPPSYASPGQITGNFKPLVDYGQEVYRDPSCASYQPCYLFPAMPNSDIPISIKTGSGSDGYVQVVFWSLEQFAQKYVNYWFVPPGVPYNVAPNYETGGYYRATSVWLGPLYFEYAQDGSRKLLGQIQTVTESANGPTTTTGISVLSDRAGIVISGKLGSFSYSDLDSALAKINSTADTAPLSDATLAGIVNSAWQNSAAQTGYAGLPYSVANPVTASDVAAWRATSPADIPKLADLLQPANAPGSSTVPISQTVQSGTGGTGSSTGLTDVNVVNTPNVTVVNDVKVDLGPNPATPTPTLEATPSASSILAPVLNLLPTYKNYAVPSHLSVCPKPSATIFGKTLVLDGHCTLLENQRPFIYITMFYIWSLVAMFIFLAA